MHTFKIVVYFLTAACMFFFGFQERKLRNDLTDDVLRGAGSGQIAEQFKRQHILNTLSPEVLVPLRRATILKFVFLALLVVEVFILQSYVP